MEALIVEDGSGVHGADSYNSIAELDAYATKFGYSDWPVNPPKTDSPNDPEPPTGPIPPNESDPTNSAADNTDNQPTAPDSGLDNPSDLNEEQLAILQKKQAAARKAAVYIDSHYGIRFTGEPLKPDQGLAWPRKEAVDFYGLHVPDDVVPIAIKRAHAEVAILAYKGVELAQQTAAGPLLTRKKIDTLEWEWDVDTYSDGPVFGWVDQLLVPLLGPAEQVGALDILGVERA